MPEVIEAVTSPGGEVYELLATPARPHPGEDLPSRPVGSPSDMLSTKEGETFVVCDDQGNLSLPDQAGMGLYYRDTRFLSRFELRVNGAAPTLLSSSAERGYLTQVDLTNPDVWEGGALTLPKQTINLRRTRVVGDVVYERIRVKNYHREPAEAVLEFTLESDFADIFEVRGLKRVQRGRECRPRLDGSTVKFAYLGTDEVFREMWVTFWEPPGDVRVDGGTVTLALRLQLRPQQTRSLSISFEPILGGRRSDQLDFDRSVARTRHSYEDWERRHTQIDTNNELFDALLLRGIRDLRALLTTTHDGEIMAAGIPWYVAPFGRDSIITSYEILMVNPEPARQTLRLLSALQGRQADPWRDEEPGKILHEIRQGELANAYYIPHTPYYGTADATPLYLMLAAAYFRWTNDLKTIAELKPTFDLALKWIDDFGDLDGDGYVEYLRRSPRGLKNQGWKDSGNSIVHADGRLAEPPIALAEVQAYVYMAKRRMAEIYALLGEGEAAGRLNRE
ncbi:MAG: amylo-alpha-1,6-glucosidase, partial [Candidatus Methylomirabilales bacterium]